MFSFLVVVVLLVIPVHAWDVNQDVQTERWSLISIYNATGGGGWRYSLNWLNPSISICDWQGIGCSSVNHTNHVTSVNLLDNPLVGTLPDHVFCGLTQLELLWFGNNPSLSGFFPNISCLSQLTGISIYSTSLTGTLPDFQWNSKLTDIYLANNQFYGLLPDFQSNQHLRYVYLNNNQFDGPLAITFLKGLDIVTLDLGYNHINSIPPIINWPSLLVLSLPGLGLSSLPSLSGAPSLVQLDLSNNQFTQLPDLTNTTISQLLADRNRLSSFPASLPPSLVKLDLSNNNISGSLPSNMSSLFPLVRHLNISHNSLSGLFPVVRDSKLGLEYEGVDKAFNPDPGQVDLTCNQFSDTTPPTFPNHSTSNNNNNNIHTTCFNQPVNDNNSFNCTNYCHPGDGQPHHVSSLPQHGSSIPWNWVGVGCGIVVVLVLIVLLIKWARVKRVPSTSMLTATATLVGEGSDQTTDNQHYTQL